VSGDAPGSHPDLAALASRRPGRTLSAYVARESLRPFCFALFGLTLVVLTRDLIGFSELVINRGVDASEVAWIALCEAVPLASLMFPFSVLIGALVALGRLGADREILVLEASGISASRLVGPVVRFAGAMSLCSLALSVWGAPAANRGLDAALARIAQHQPWSHFRAGVASQFGGWRIEAREVSARGDELRGVLLWMPDIAQTVFARRAVVTSGGDGVAEIILEDGSLLLGGDRGPEQLRFETLKAELPGSSEAVIRPLDEQLRGWRLDALRAAAREFVPSEGDPVSRAAVELQRRFATPAATLIFGFLAVPLFLTRRQFSRSGGSMLGVLATVAHFALAQLGEGLMQAGSVGVAAGVWLPNGVVLAVGVTLFVRARRAGVLGHSFDRPTLDERGFSFLAFRSHHSGKPRRRALARYISGRFLQLLPITFVVLLSAYLLIDVMERLSWFARYDATGLEIARFYTARIPLLASRVIPMSLLISTALIVSLLGVDGELMGMRSCGIPAPRALLPVLLISLAVVPMYFLLRDEVVTRTNALADRLKTFEITPASAGPSRVWQRTGHRILVAERFDPDRGYGRNLTIYEMGDDGLPRSRTDARAARHIGRGIWRLSDPRRVEVSEGHVREVASSAYADLGVELDAEVDTMHFSVRQLAREIAQVEADGYDATPLRVDFHTKLADPLACVVLPASVLFFAVAGPPYAGPALTLLVSGGIAVAYILLTGIGTSLGRSGTLPAVIGGWAPTLALVALTGFLAWRMWRRL
jgi:LPS export ABC transporter permease LptG